MDEDNIMEDCGIIVLDDLLQVIQRTFLKEVKIGEDRPVEESDFVEERNEIERNLLYICETFIKFTNSCDFESLNKVSLSELVVCVLLLCGEHSDNKCAWTTNNTVKTSELILNVLCKWYSCADIKMLINSDDRKTLLPTLFNKLRPKLLRDTWKRYPAAVSSYQSVILMIQIPYVADVLHMVMPTVLILLEDYVTSNRVTGLICLHHIVNNITKTELSWYCDIEVLYKTLHPMIYNMEPDLVNPLINCLIAVISKTVSKEDKLKWTYYDDILNVWLPSIEMEQKLVLRTEYMVSLQMFLESMGISCVRWSKKLLSIFEEYAAIPHDRENCFKTMHSFLTVSWPRVSSNFDKIITIIMKSLLDVIDDKHCVTNDKDKDLLAIVSCLDLLNLIVPDKMEQLKCDIKDNSTLSKEFKEYFYE